MKRSYLLTILLLSGWALSAQQSWNMTELANWDDDNLPSTFSNTFNDCWGWVDCDGREYALVGSAAYVHFFDLLDPSQPLEVDRFAGGATTTWRDLKTYRDRAYTVCDNCNEGLQIFDLSTLPDTVVKIDQTTAFFGRSHNIFIDEGQGRLYAAGTDSAFFGLVILDLQADPDQPVRLANVSLAGGYVHDLYVRDHIAYCNHGNNGLVVYDLSDPGNPIVLGSLTSYPESGYNHSCWLHDDGVRFVFADESFGRAVKLADVSDLTDIQITDIFRSVLLAPADSSSIPHNPLIRGDLVFISYYHDGVEVFDLSDPDSVVKVAYYDTEPNNTMYNGFTGCWGVYPFLPSGHIIASDMNNGLFILSVDGIELADVDVPLTPSSALTLSGSPDLCEGDSLQIQASEAADAYAWYDNGVLLGQEGSSITVSAAGQYHVQISDQYCPGYSDTVLVTILPIPDAQFTAASAEACSGETILLMAVPGADSYQWYLDDEPIPGADQPTFEANASGDYQVEVSMMGCSSLSEAAGLTFFPVVVPTIDQVDLLLIASNGLFYQWYLDGEPIPGAEGNSWNATESGFYQVAVTDANGCTALSEMIEVVINGVEEFAAPVWQVFPNPAKSGEAIRLSGPAATVAVFSADGRLLQEENGWEQGEWKISPLPAGWYTLRLQNEQAVEVVRIVVQ